MRVPLTWLKEFVDITISPAELAYRLTVAGVEVSKIEYIGVAPGGPNTFGVSEELGLAWDRSKILVGQIVEVLPHPNADRLVLADVDYGAETRSECPGTSVAAPTGGREPASGVQLVGVSPAGATRQADAVAGGAQELHRVVTGAPNIFYLKGQGKLTDGPKVVFAREGSQLYDGHAEGRKLMTLKPSKIRGIPSSAMVCSEKELGLSEEHEGIIILDAGAPVGMPLADYMGDVVLHIEILPNIARCQSIIGVAREVAALTGAPFKGTDQGRLGGSTPALEVVDNSESQENSSLLHSRAGDVMPSPYALGAPPARGQSPLPGCGSPEAASPDHASVLYRRGPKGPAGWVKLQIDAPELCPRYSAALIRGVHIGPSPEWMQRRLRLVGVRAISNIVDITNYVMMEWGQPLHAFDYDKLVQRAESGPRPQLAAAEPPNTGPDAGQVGDGARLGADRDRWLDDGGPTRGAAATEPDVIPVADAATANDTPHVTADRDRWLDDGGPTRGAAATEPGISGTADAGTANDTPHVTGDTDRRPDGGGHPPAGSALPTIIVRRALEGEHLTTLDSTDRALTPDMLMIADTAGSIALAGIMGGSETEIDEHTTNVLLEAAAFNFINNRKSAGALKLPSEATARFGRGVPPAYTIPSATRAADLMRQLAQGEPAPQIVDAYPGRHDSSSVMHGRADDVRPPAGRAPQTVIHFDTTEIRRLLGIDVPVERITSILKSLDFEVREPVEPGRAPARLMDGAQKSGPFPALRQSPAQQAQNTADAGAMLSGLLPEAVAAVRAGVVLEIVVPEHRLDVSIPADIVEEVARVIGYDQIPATLMRDELPPQRHNLSLEAEDLVRDIMVGCGLQEIISYPLTTVEREALLFPDPAQADLDEASYVTIANPISPERKVMRHTLLSSLLDTLREALRHRERVLLFEIGRVYLPQSGSNLPGEHTRLTIALAGPREPQSWLRGKRTAPLDFFDLKGIVDTLVQRLHVQGVQLTPSEHPTFHPARSAMLSAGDSGSSAGERNTPSVARQSAEDAGDAPRPLGVFGEVHPEVREHFGLPHDPVCLAEFDLGALRAAMTSPRFQKLPRFPAIREDIALIVDENVPAAQVEAVIREAGGAMLRSTTLFDLYRGDQVGAGRKSLAYALTYQHDERTLTDDEAAKIRGRIVKKLRDAVGAELRG